MAHQLKLNPSARLEAARLRQQASELLNRLVADRDASERRAADAGRRDPMKSITGRTALDGAIASARTMIEHMDALLGEMGKELAAADGARPSRSTGRHRRGLTVTTRTQVPVAAAL